MSLLLKTGSSGPHVRMVQELLNYRRVTQPPLLVDGLFGPKTKAAVVKFQQSAQLKPDGVVGPMTGQALAGLVFLSLMRG